ncbi:MAG: hypothetical protein WA989_13690 [Henriciella sp.]|uniref:hypothetical protein n=1 Tax=Henriciella sp. TaxID=1968823 RepID=UPI003C76117A
MGLKAAIPLLALLLASCATSKSYSSCKQDVERLKAAINETAYFLEALESELLAADTAVRQCDAQIESCTASLWIEKLEQIDLQTIDARSRFTRADELWRPEACLDYTSAYRINPPPPERYKAYYETYDKVERQIDELMDWFGVFLD